MLRPVPEGYVPSTVADVVGLLRIRTLLPVREPDAAKFLAVSTSAMYLEAT